jgi:alpha-tubulin suppressor-like RCC1 family protein
MILRAYLPGVLVPSLLGACGSSESPPLLGIVASSHADASTGASDGSMVAADDASDAAPADRGTSDGAAVTTMGIAVAVGARHACALASHGVVLCWGDNRDGQLGDGTTKQRNTPVAVTGLMNPVVAIAAGDAHTCALDSTGAVLCWGSNASGALGDGSNAAQRSTPGPVPGLSGVTSIAAGGTSTCVAASGNALCWGANQFGQLGDGTTKSPSAPTATMGLVGGLQAGASSLAPSADHTCVIASNGSVECAGDATNGALGNGGNLSVATYVSSGVTSGALAVTSGIAVSCALINDGTVQCWGFGGDGELGNGGRDSSDMPVPVSNLAGATGVAAGFHHVCAVAAGAVSCWGNLGVDGLDGGLDEGGATAEPTPVAIEGLSGGVSGVAAGGGTCAVTKAGAVLCWGDNSFGQIGDGTTTSRPAPVRVVGF